MDDYTWAEAQNKKVERIKELVGEIVENHKKMQELLAEAIIQCQADRGVRAIEQFLNPDKE